MLIIGLSGGIGSGKTTVGKLFSELSITVIDADDIAREVVEKGENALAEIAEHFGDDVLLPDGSLNRAHLRALVFNAPSEKHWLEQLTHPLINQRTHDKIAAASSPYVLYISPLLIERGATSFVERVLIVDCDEDQQLTRTTKRDNNSEQLVQAIMDHQCSRTERLAKADDVILNDGDENHLREKVLSLHQHYLELANV